MLKAIDIKAELAKSSFSQGRGKDTTAAEQSEAFITSTQAEAARPRESSSVWINEIRAS